MCFLCWVTSKEVLIRHKTIYKMVSNNNCLTLSHAFCSSDVPFKFLPYQLSMVVYWTTMAVTGNEEFGFDFGEGA